MARPSSRETVMLAAEDVVLEVGASHLTLDAVAERAGLSKGGVLYHFPNKEALLVAMLERLMDDYRTRSLAAFQAQPEGRGRALRTHVTVALSEDRTDQDRRRCRIASALVAAMAHAPELMDVIKNRLGAVLRSLAYRDGALDPRKAIVMLAADGFVFWEMMKTSPLSPDEQCAIARELLAMATEVGDEHEQLP